MQSKYKISTPMTKSNAVEMDTVNNISVDQENICKWYITMDYHNSLSQWIIKMNYHNGISPWYIPVGVWQEMYSKAESSCL